MPMKNSAGTRGGADYPPRSGSQCNKKGALDRLRQCTDRYPRTPSLGIKSEHSSNSFAQVGHHDRDLPTAVWTPE